MTLVRVGTSCLQALRILTPEPEHLKNRSNISKPSWFVIAANDHTIAPEQEISTAKRMGAKILTVPSSHVAMLAQPDKVADFVIEAAAALDASKAA